MKTLCALIALLPVTLLGFSQGLTPLVFYNDSGDTVICFSIKDSRVVARYVSMALSCDSIMREYEPLVSELDSLAQSRERQIEMLKEAVNANHDVAALETTRADVAEKGLRKARRNANRLVGVSAIMGLLLAISLLI
jgi:hypothetical protein